MYGENTQAEIGLGSEWEQFRHTLEYLHCTPIQRYIHENGFVFFGFAYQCRVFDDSQHIRQTYFGLRIVVRHLDWVHCRDSGCVV
jgi:hypothetical protein